MLVSPPPEQLSLPDGLQLLQARISLRLREATTLPKFKGALLRGAFGYAFQRISCPRACWGHADNCTAQPLCPYRRVFETPHPPDITHLHDLRDVPPALRTLLLIGSVIHVGKACVFGHGGYTLAAAPNRKPTA